MEKMEVHMGRFRVRPLARGKQAEARRGMGTNSNNNHVTAARQRFRDRRGRSDTTVEAMNSRSSLDGRTSSPPAATSDVTTDVANLQARLAWVESLVNKRNLLGEGRLIEDVATGAPISQFRDTADQAQQDPVSQSVTRPDARLDGTAPSPPIALSQGMDLNGDAKTLSTRAHPLSSEAELEVDERGSIPQPPPLDLVQSDQLTLINPHKLVNAYFRDVNRAYPFVNRHTIFKTLERLGSDIFNRSLCDEDTDCLIAYLVMAIGSTTLQRAEHLPRTAPASSIQVDYQQILSRCLTKESYESLKVLLLVAILSSVDPQRCYSTASIIDLLARRAIRLGLTKREVADRGLDPAEAEWKHRLFWSVYTLDRMVAVTTGTPVALNGVDMNIPLPGITVDEFASSERLEQSSTLQVNRQIIQLRILEDKILHEIHLRDPDSTRSLTQADRKTLVTGLHTEIENWYTNGCLLQSTEPDDLTIHVRISWLAARYYNLLLFLYYPSLLNPGHLLLPRGELMSIAQKHVQANAARLQQQQLPLNHITLCRVFPVCMVFLYIFLSSRSAPDSFTAGEELLLCADILAAFPSEWRLARRGAELIRQLASLAAVNSTPTSVPASFSGQETWAFSEGDKAWCHAIKVNLTELAEQALGPGSVYLSIDRWMTEKTGAGSLSSAETLVGTFSEDTYPNLPNSSAASYLGTSIYNPIDLIDVNGGSYNGELSFMDFL